MEKSETMTCGDSGGGKENVVDDNKHSTYCITHKK